MLWHTIIRAAAIPAGIFLGAAAAVTVVLLAPNFLDARGTAEHVPQPVRVARAHHCWQGPAPADMQGKVPGHVVVVRNGDTIYGGPRLVRKGLEHVFQNRHPRLTVVAFCR